MKIGILTFYRANNYGAMLQAYSLQKKLEELGHVAECIDYRCPAIEIMHGKQPVELSLGVKKIVKNTIKNYLTMRRERAFSDFRMLIPHSTVYTPETISLANDQYDAFVTGSDQVFNLQLTQNDENYFLSFVEKGKMKVAYAASMGPYLQEKEERYRALLKSFDHLSVREKTTSEVICHKLSISCQDMPDPIFLHTDNEWRALLKIGQKKANKRYILVYALFGSEELFQVAKQVAVKKNLPIILVTKILNPRFKYDQLIRETDPRNFVELIDSADYVLTDSFHGTSLSIILKKKFGVVLPPKAPERIMDLLNACNMQDRIVRDEKFNCDVICSDDSILTGFKQRGINYLTNL